MNATGFKTPQLLHRELNNLLLHEPGWPEVGKGLGKLLMGYALWIGGAVVGIALMVIPLLEVGAKADLTRLEVHHFWMFFGGAGIISLTGLFSYFMIFGAQVKCALSAPERWGTRMFMFLVLTCMAMGPVLSLVSWASGLDRPPDLQRGVAGLQHVRYTQIGMILQMASVLLGMCYTGFFALFLRGTALCMGSPGHVRMVDFFLSLFLPLTMVSGYLGLQISKVERLSELERFLKPLMFVGLGWVVCFVFWLVVVVAVKFLIDNTMTMVRTPMEYSTATAAVKGLRQRTTSGY